MRSKQPSSVRRAEARGQPTETEDLAKERRKNPVMKRLERNPARKRRARMKVVITKEEGKDSEDEDAEAREELLQPLRHMVLPLEASEVGLRRTRSQM